MIFLHAKLSDPSSLLDSIMPVIDAVSSGVWWMELLVQVAEGFVSVMSPMIETVLAPLNDALTLTGEMLAQVFLPIFDSIYPIMQILGDMLMTVVVPAFQLLSPIIELVALVFDALTPVIALVGKALTVVISPIQYVADLLSWLGKWISYFGECIGTAVYNITHPFSSRDMPSSPGGFSSASYQGATQVSINIYQEAPVVGEGGMRQFAQMIREEFTNLDYYNVTI